MYLFPLLMSKVHPVHIELCEEEVPLLVQLRAQYKILSRGFFKILIAPFSTLGFLVKIL